MKYSFINYMFWMGIIVFIFIIIAIYAPLHSGPRGKRIETMAKIDSIALAISEHYKEHGVLETNRLYLQNKLVSIPTNMCDSIWCDSWGGGIILTMGSNSEWFTVNSFGPDGRPSSDDLVISQNVVKGVESKQW